VTMFFSVASRGVPCVAYTSRTAPLPPHALSQNKKHIKTLLGRCEDRKGRINIGAYIATTKSNEIVSAVQIHHANERRYKARQFEWHCNCSCSNWPRSICVLSSYCAFNLSFSSCAASRRRSSSLPCDVRTRIELEQEVTRCNKHPNNIKKKQFKR